MQATKSHAISLILVISIINIMSFNLPQSNKKRVVIVGGGIRGLKLANKQSDTDFQVVNIDRNNYHK